MDDGIHDAAANLHLLDVHFRQHPATGRAERRRPSITPGAPLNLDVVDHIGACVAEVVDHAQAVTSGPLKPLPSRVSGVYDWYVESTAGAGREAQLVRDKVIQRQRLEHAIALGEYKVVRTHPCPACATWGLQWDPYGKRALCLNRRCRDRNGMARTWSLARLATQYVIRQENRATRAT